MIAELFDLHRNNKVIQKNTTASYRLRKLRKLKGKLLESKADICNALSLDLGKAPVETELTEIMPVISMINYTMKELKRWMKDEKVTTPLLFKGASSYIRYEAKGNCLVISPWNYPFQLSLYPVLTSFIAGNTTIIKPSEYTPNTNKVVDDLFKSVFSESEVALVEGGVKESSELLELDFDHIFFTGSTEVGKVVMSAASKNLSSVSLELGGKSPVFIDKNYDINSAVKKIAWGKLVNAGQTCVAPDYLLCFEKSIPQITESFNKYVANAYGDDILKSDDYCHIITERHATRLEELIEDAVSKGAKILSGGKRIADKIIEPTLITDVTKDMKVMQEEIFGPILPLVVVKDVNQAVEYINSNHNPLSSYIFSDKENTQEAFMSNTFSGGVTINDLLINVANCKIPFGGAGKSGIGNYHGHEGFKEFSNQRSVMNRKFEMGAHYFYPPYTESKAEVVRKLFSKFSGMF